MPHHSPQKTKRFHKALLAIAGVACILLLASLRGFLNEPNHRIAGIAFNALFLLFGSLITLLFSLTVLANTIHGAVSLKTGLPAATLPGLTAAYCLYRAFPGMIGV